MWSFAVAQEAADAEPHSQVLCYHAPPQFNRSFEHPMGTVLTLDGSQRSALAIVRSLGNQGVDVISADTGISHLAARSQFVSTSVDYPDAYTDIERFVATVGALAEQYRVQAIIPATDVTTNSLVLLRDRLPAAVKLALPELEAYEQLTDKHQLLQVAATLGLPAPQSVLMQPGQALAPTTAETGPAVLKPTRSKYLVGNRWQSSSVKIAADAADVNTLIQQHDWFQNHPFMLQEFIEGQGQGIFALYNHGEAVCFFAHRRLREKPPSGGVSVLCESVAPDPQMMELSRRLLDHVGWHGVAMVEFKVARDGTPYLMEVNTRFWGSLQLAVDSGVDFPYMLYQIAMGQRPTPPSGYRIGQRLRWFLGDVDSLYLSLRDPGVALREKLKRVGAFCTPGFGRTRHEVLRWSDRGPGWYELGRYLARQP